MAATAVDTDDHRMSLTDHLVELRRRFFISALAIVVVSIAAYVLYDHVQLFLVNYYRDATHVADDKFITTGPLEGFAIRLRLCSYIGLFGSSPVWLWQLWRFITPGLNPKEKKYAIPFLLSSVFLFLFGAVVALLTLPAALDFLVANAGKEVRAFYTLDKFVSLVTLVVIAFGFSFLFPVVLVFLELVNVLHWKTLLRGWRYAIVIIFVIAAVITPSQDPYSLVGMAGPMTLFYFASIGIGWLAKRNS
jgi:sec-independent protein translocase protein TatC